ncbi:hypothetical protein JW926_14070 [Candidatus Sumerlaeota bacterium]|nr:hypothetical protein [Candidatus Sumerlaeota bacterium]
MDITPDGSLVVTTHNCSREGSSPNGVMVILKGATGEFIGASQSAPPKDYEYVRDIVVDSTAMTIYGIVESGIVMWEGGNPMDISQYKCRTLFPKRGTKKVSVEGISLDPHTRTLQIVPSYGDSLLFVDMKGNVEKTDNFPPSERRASEMRRFRDKGSIIKGIRTKSRKIYMRI